MADYYIDGSVAGSAGVLNGSGTQVDPWTQNSGVDLLEAARQAIIAGAGIGSTGDVIIVLDGGLSLTAPLTYESGWSQIKPFVVRPFVMDGTQRIDFDMGYQKMISVDITQQGHNFYFTDFHGFGSVATSGAYVINGRNWWGFYFCKFDGSDAHASGATGIFNAGSSSHFVGNRYLNDARSSGLLIACSSGCCIRGNYFEIDYVAYAFYTYGSEFANNVFRVTSAANLGFVLPIQGGLMRNNTFYGVDAATPVNNGGSIYIPPSYEHNMVTNNYFENMGRAIYIPSTDQHNMGICAGNYMYNIQDTNLGKPNASNTTFLDNNDFALSRSGLVDPANGDYRPNDLLIGKGFNLENYSLQGVTTGRKTIGAIEVDLMPPRVRDIY